VIGEENEIGNVLNFLFKMHFASGTYCNIFVPGEAVPVFNMAGMYRWKMLNTLTSMYWMSIILHIQLLFKLIRFHVSEGTLNVNSIVTTKGIWWRMPKATCFLPNHVNNRAIHIEGWFSFDDYDLKKLVYTLRRK